MIGAVFWPTALPHLLGIPMVEFTDRRVDVSLILGYEAELLRQKILEQETPEHRIQILEHYLLHKLHRVSQTLDIVDCAVRAILDQK